MLGIDARAARSTWTVIAIAVLVLILYRIRGTIFLLVAALMFAYLLWPLVDYLDKHLPGRSRTPALLIVYSLVIAALLFVGIEIGTHAAREANALAGRAPEFLSRIQGLAGHLPSSRSGSASSLTDWAVALLASYAKNVAAVLPRAGLKLLVVAKDLIFVVLVPVLSFFILQDGRAFRRRTLSLVGNGNAARQDLAEAVARDLDLLLGKYVRALVILASVAFSAYGVFLALIKVHYALLLAAIAGPLDFIPVVGPIAAFVIIMLVSGLTGSDHLIWITIFLIVFRICQDYFISPRIMSRQVKIHPLIIILGVLAGAEIAGVAGAFLSVPAMAALRILYLRLVDRRIEVPSSNVRV